MTKWKVRYRVKHEFWGHEGYGEEIASAWSPVDAMREVKQAVLARIKERNWVESLAITVRCVGATPVLCAPSIPALPSLPAPLAGTVDAIKTKSARVRVSAWWNGFGVGVWCSVWPSGPVWSIALGPVTLYILIVSKTPPEEIK